MKVSYSIRPANKHDASALAEILTESWKQAYINLLPTAELNATANREKYAAAFSIRLPESFFDCSRQKNSLRYDILPPSPRHRFKWVC